MEKNINDNSTTAGISIHDIICIDKSQRGDLGKSWHTYKKLGVVMRVDENGLTMREPDGDSFSYTLSELDGDDECDYIFTISKGSEIEYLEKIDDAIESERNRLNDKVKDIEKLKAWRHDFEYGVSFIGRMARFIKSFQN